MLKQFLSGTLLVFPLLLSADTLTLKNGTRFRGTFNTGNSAQISFTEYSGNRRNIDLQDVLELRFGNDRAGDPVGRPLVAPGYGRNGQANPDVYRDGAGRNPPQQPLASSVMVEDLDRLQADLQGAMDNNDLTDDQRQSLDDSRATLRAAAQQSRNGRPVNQRNVRLALDSIRNASSRMQRQDRDVLNEDIRRVSTSVNGGRDY